MISASHNSYGDNGIKLFGPDGFKLSDEVEQEIEHHMDNGLTDGLAAPSRIGRAKRIEDAQARYIEFAKRTFPRRLSLEGIRIVVDCAHGAAYKVAPTALWELGAEVFSVGVDPNGTNINEGCGSTSTDMMAGKVRELRADIGIALDGDADRVIIVDEHGEVVDGDQVMAAIATSWSGKDMLQGGGIVATVMSNLGLERYLEGQGLKLARTKVGDRYVVEHMRAHGFNLGGEQSGHVVLSDFATTGDGLIAALQVLAVMAETEKPLSEICRLFDPLPQLLRNVRFRDGAPLEDDEVKDAIETGTQALGNSGRLVIRKSGTEPLIRVMAEGDDEALVTRVVNDICTVIEARAG